MLMVNFKLFLLNKKKSIWTAEGKMNGFNYGTTVSRSEGVPSFYAPRLPRLVSVFTKQETVAPYSDD